MNKINSKITFTEITSWMAIGLITIAAFFCTYYYHFAGPILALLWLGWLVASLGLAYFTCPGKQAFNFAKEAKVELEKVVWPNRQETIQTTSIVMIMVTVTGFVLWLIDSGMMWAIGKITHLG